MNIYKTFVVLLAFFAVSTQSPAQNADNDIFSEKKIISLKDEKPKGLGFFSRKNVNYECGTFSYYSPNQIFKMESGEGTIYYNSSLKMAGFQANYYHQIYYLFMNENTRNKLKQNVEQYFADFESHSLLKSGKTYKKYGEAPVRLEWGTIPSMIDAYGNGKIQFGYRFYDNSPYFTLTVWPVKNLEKNKAAGSAKSIKIQYFFTKKQAETIAILLSNENLSEQLSPYMENLETPESETHIESDKY